MDLVRDVLDKQVVDRSSDRLGKVDGIIATIDRDGPPRISALEIGPVTLARRLSSRLERAVSGLLRWLEIGPGATRFEISLVKDIHIEVMLDVDGDRTEARRIEHWVRDRIVSRIPGSGVKG
jgi:hypothetical protein